ncbi:hypothetical protein Q428_14550 [Fervidicella metallireducens AeB]|uniref:Aminopeptidase n=1 Tax=Fervidicella metallireducens AeB TaxID=1403537 RepID=A0A017RTI7_9CLOT|nr:aminopeptidase [Fervidicella metallireducens]EYE87215.1 hypothetical protein Q428_14550 [Fervidicella metallireducens AeB]
MNFVELIPNIVKGIDVKKGSVVLIQFWGENGDLNVLDKFAIEIAKKGGVPLKWQYSREFFKNYFSEVADENLDFPDKYFEIFNVADMVIDLCMYIPPSPHKDFPREKIPFYRNYMMKLFGSIRDKECFIQIKVPTIENAEAAGIEFNLYEEAVLEAMGIDYDNLKESCSCLIEKLYGKNIVEIYTGENSKLTFELGNREWHKDDGNGDIPCGEIYIAPIEESAQGEIIIPNIYLQGKVYENVIMKFIDGKLADCSEAEVLEHIKSYPGDCDVIGEFGVGLNENVRKLIGYTALDEKCIGTAHIAVGMNDMFGGKNSTPLHMDFVFTPSKILIDNTVIMENSNIVIK